MVVISLTVRFTTSSLMYERLNGLLEWKHGRTYVPKGGKKLICLLDDLNMAHVSMGHLSYYCFRKCFLNLNWLPKLLAYWSIESLYLYNSSSWCYPWSLLFLIFVLYLKCLILPFGVCIIWGVSTKWSAFETFQVDEHGFQSALELIRQHLDEGGFYSPDNFQWRYVRNVTYVSTMNPKPNMSVPTTSPRLLRHFALFHCPMPR